MSTLSLRLPDSLHKNAKIIAKEESISINQLIANALSEKIASLLTEKYLEERSLRGDEKKFMKVLAKIPQKELHPDDKI